MKRGNYFTLTETQGERPKAAGKKAQSWGDAASPPEGARETGLFGEQTSPSPEALGILAAGPLIS